MTDWLANVFIIIPQEVRFLGEIIFEYNNYFCKYVPCDLSLANSGGLIYRLWQVESGCIAGGAAG